MFYIKNKQTDIKIAKKSLVIKFLNRILNRIRTNLQDRLAIEVIEYIIFCHNIEIEVSKAYIQSLLLNSRLSTEIFL